MPRILTTLVALLVLTGRAYAEPLPLPSAVVHSAPFTEALARIDPILLAKMNPS